MQGCLRAGAGREAAAAVPGCQLWRTRGSGNRSQGAAAGGVERPRGPLSALLSRSVIIHAACSQGFQYLYLTEADYAALERMAKQTGTVFAPCCPGEDGQADWDRAFKVEFKSGMSIRMARVMSFMRIRVWFAYGFG
eukprot:1161625-Pelagomonas_calceolata.AAC.7